MNVYKFDEEVFYEKRISFEVNDDGLHGIMLKRDLTVHEVVCTLECVW